MDQFLELERRDSGFVAVSDRSKRGFKAAHSRNWVLFWRVREKG
jgi:hypothetical protein